MAELKKKRTLSVDRVKELVAALFSGNRRTRRASAAQLAQNEAVARRNDRIEQHRTAVKYNNLARKQNGTRTKFGVGTDREKSVLLVAEGSPAPQAAALEKGVEPPSC